MKRIQLRESELVNLIRKVINEDVSCKCAQLNIVRHLNAEGNVWKETHEVVFVDCPCGSKGAFSPIDSGPKGELGELPKKIVRIKADGTEERRINELADCRCGGFVELGEMCPDPLNTRCTPHAGGCTCTEADKAMEEFDDYEDGDTELVGCPSCGSPDQCGCYPNCYPCIPNPNNFEESDLRRLVKRAINEQEETITHEELMDGIDKYCPEVLEKEKMVGNRSCSRCHTPIMGIIKRWCESNKN